MDCVARRYNIDIYLFASIRQKKGKEWKEMLLLNILLDFLFKKK
jgi:hypothetical protein